MDDFANLNTLGTSRSSRLRRNLPRYVHDDLVIINREGLPGNVKNARCLTVQDVVMTAGRQVIGQALELVLA